MKKANKTKAKRGLVITGSILGGLLVGGLVMGMTSWGTQLYSKVTKQEIVVQKEVGRITERTFFKDAEVEELEDHNEYVFTFRNGTKLTYHEVGQTSERTEWSKTASVFTIDGSAVSYEYTGDFKYFINGTEIVDQEDLEKAIKEGKSNDTIVIKAFVKSNENVLKEYVAPVEEDTTEEA